MKDEAIRRCAWSLGSEIYIRYHDREWGVPVHDDRTQFEFLLLEGAQAGLLVDHPAQARGLSRGLAGFDAARVARFGASRIEALLNDPGIVRNRLKVESAVNNARRFLAVQEEFSSFDAYIWRFVDGEPIQNRRRTLKRMPATTKESDALSKDLKQRGFKFVGSTIVYSHMQATGMVNDHLVSCFRHAECARLGGPRT
jgi:DNA-3-methyladenine glycosylase I